MKYVCPKCGKSIEVSTESLIASEYFIVCPQCLTRLQIVGDYAYVPLKDGSLQLEKPEPAPAEDVEILPPPLTGETIPASAPTTQPAAAIDPLFGEAVRFLGQCNAITPMMLRDRLGISLERAQTLIGQLEQAGIVGPYNHGGPRQILIPHNTGMPSPFQPAPSSEPVGTNEQHASQNNSDNKTYSFTCSGCLTWFLVAAFVLFMLRNCTGG
ncbi:MAG: hypothetical protein IJ775_05960 [Muribaculaceae bacterium]|nr:hypothetical protein [Muribaculaceae bacterium]